MARDDPTGSEERGQLLLAAMPLRHLIEAETICRSRGTAVLPAGGKGDLDHAPVGTSVLFIASDAGISQVPAATWRAELVGTVTTDRDAFPEGLPAGWVEERRASPREPPPTRAPFGDDEEDEQPFELEMRQAYFEVRFLSELPSDAWIFVNELVPKRERGGRAYFPRSPRLVDPPP